MKAKKSFSKYLKQKREFQSGGLSSTQLSAGASLAGTAVDAIPPDSNGLQSEGAATLSGAAKGAAVGSQILPGWGTAAGAVIGGVSGYLGSHSAHTAMAKAMAQKRQLDQTKQIQDSTAILSNYDNMGTGIKSLEEGGILYSWPGGYNVNPLKYTPTKNSFLSYQKGGKMPIQAGNGTLQPIGQSNAYEVKGHEPGATDDVKVGDAYVDHNEVVKPSSDGMRIFSDTLKPPGSSEPFSKIAKKLEKQKTKETSKFPLQNARIEKKLDDLFQLQQKLNGDNDGESTQEALQPTGEQPGEGMSQGNMFDEGGEFKGLPDLLSKYPIPYVGNPASKNENLFTSGEADQTWKSDKDRFKSGGKHFESLNDLLWKNPIPYVGEAPVSNNPLFTAGQTYTGYPKLPKSFKEGGKVNNNKELFVYGTLKNRKTLEKAEGEHTLPKEIPQTLKGYHKVGHNYATEEPGGVTKGDMVHVTDSELNKLDNYEKDYHRIEVKPGEFMYVRKSDYDENGKKKYIDGGRLQDVNHSRTLLMPNVSFSGTSAGKPYHAITPEATKQWKSNGFASHVMEGVELTKNGEGIYEEHAPHDVKGYYQVGGNIGLGKVGQLYTDPTKGPYPIESWKSQGVNTADSLNMGTMYHMPYSAQKSLYGVATPQGALPTDVNRLTTVPGQESPLQRILAKKNTVDFHNVYGTETTHDKMGFKTGGVTKSNYLPGHVPQMLMPVKTEPYNPKLFAGGHIPSPIGVENPVSVELTEHFKKGGTIHINPKNKGKFNALKAKTGKTTEQLTHSKNPLTRKRAIFAQNAKKWKHENGGLVKTYQLGGEDNPNPDIETTTSTLPATTTQKGKLKFNWRDGLASASALAPIFANQLAADQLPQVAQPYLTSPAQFKKINAADQINAAGQGLRSGFLASKINSSNPNVQRGGMGEAQAGYLNNLNSIYGDVNRLNAGITNQEAMFNTGVTARNNQLLTERNQAEVARRANILGLKSQNRAALSNTLQGMIGQENLKGLDKQKYEMYLNFLKTQGLDPNSANRQGYLNWLEKHSDTPKGYKRGGKMKISMHNC